MEVIWADGGSIMASIDCVGDKPIASLQYFCII